MHKWKIIVFTILLLFSAQVCWASGQEEYVITEAQIVTIEKQLTILESNNSRYKKELSELRKQLAEAKSQLLLSKQASEKMKTQLDALEKSCKQLENKLNKEKKEKKIAAGAAIFFLILCIL